MALAYIGKTLTRWGEKAVISMLGGMILPAGSQLEEAVRSHKSSPVHRVAAQDWDPCQQDLLRPPSVHLYQLQWVSVTLKSRTPTRKMTTNYCGKASH